MTALKNNTGLASHVHVCQNIPFPEGGRHHEQNQHVWSTLLTGYCDGKAALDKLGPRHQKLGGGGGGGGAGLAGGWGGGGGWAPG